MDETGKQVFQFFNEVGIIQQLSAALFNKRLPDGLHVSHFSVLNHLVRLGDGKTPLALASAFQVSKGTMTNTLSKLSQRGLVRLAPHETDGRSKVVFITDEGRAFQQEAIGLLAPSIVALGEKIDWERVVDLLPELQRIRMVLDENRDI
ncbi:MarR family winged helix-turn-helix transcriptional regulator [Pseudahrensia aquimaris]|uniref:MarR family winged helix-turn-helix transcriptional regulator n=1 Tax=Pseudahrensia aquimaris TaxID=744461 RepID=A0ABW3FEU6_9HYPH